MRKSIIVLLTATTIAASMACGQTQEEIPPTQDPRRVQIATATLSPTATPFPTFSPEPPGSRTRATPTPEIPPTATPAIIMATATPQPTGPAPTEQPPKATGTPPVLIMQATAVPAPTPLYTATPEPSPAATAPPTAPTAPALPTPEPATPTPTPTPGPSEDYFLNKDCTRQILDTNLIIKRNQFVVLLKPRTPPEAAEELADLFDAGIVSWLDNQYGFIMNVPCPTWDSKTTIEFLENIQEALTYDERVSSARANVFPKGMDPGQTGNTGDEGEENEGHQHGGEAPHTHD